jgi:hypothetical protein
VGGAVVLVLRSPGSAVLGRRVALVGGTLIAVGTLFAVSPAGENFRHRLYQWKQDLGGPRTGVWLDSLALFRRHPWLGTGPETFAGEFRKIESVTLSRAYPDFYHETPHDVFLDAATGQGIPGLLILAGVFWVGWTGRARPGGTPAGLEAALAAIFVCSLFASFSLVEFICLWTISGISAALRRTGAVDAGASSAGGAQIPATLLGGALIVLAVVLAIPDQADAQLQDAVDDKNPVAAAEALDRANRWSFGLPGYELWQSREMATLGRSLGNSAQAAAAWHKAIEASAAAETRGEERFSAELQSSILAITTGDLNRAELKARDASALAPNWYKPHLLLGQILQAEGRTQEGISEQQLALNLGAPRAR